jgi:hypothetical protein
LTPTDPATSVAVTNRRGSWERAIVLAVVVLLVLARSAVFVFWEQSFFDSDQAVMGLMAKHLTELRAFPVFMYGQSYILGVEAWMAAPMFLLFGVSVASLKLPLLAINVAVAVLLVRVLEREAGLRPAWAGMAAIFFVLCPPGTAAHLVDASGGNLEPFLYVILIWLLRRRPAWCGLILGVGFLQREFTVYGLIALLTIEAADRSLFTRDGIRRRLAMLRTAAEVWLVVQVLQLHSSAAGPGTSAAMLHTPSNNILEIAARTCVDPGTLVTGAGRIASMHWPQLFGTMPQPLLDFGIDSGGRQGLWGVGVLLAAAMLLAAARVVTRLLADRRWDRRDDFCAYLTLVGALSAIGYIAGRCGEVGLLLRYDLLSIFGAVGLGAWFLRAERSRRIVIVWLIMVGAWGAIQAGSHARLWAEYLRHPPDGAKRLIIRHLDARGVHYGTADYWIAYYVTFVTNERIILASNDFVRIPYYGQIVAEHANESLRVSRGACEGGREIVPDVYLCPH